jgi:hypothetical protein
MRQPHFASGRRPNLAARPGARTAICTAAMITVLSATLGPAAARTDVGGSPDAVYLRAENATVGEVLAALSARFKLKYPPSSHQVGHTITGVYSGSLRYVLSRVLDGSSYMLAFVDDIVEIKLLGTAGSDRSASNDRLPPEPGVTIHQSAPAPALTAAAAPVTPSEIPRLVPK